MLQDDGSLWIIDSSFAGHQPPVISESDSGILQHTGLAQPASLNHRHREAYAWKRQRASLLSYAIAAATYAAGNLPLLRELLCVAERLASWGAAFSRSRKACAEHWLRTQVQGRFLRAHYTGLVRCCLPARQSRRSHPSTVVGSAARAPFLTATRRCYATRCSVTHRHGARWTMTRPLWRGRTRCAAWRSTRWMDSASYRPSHLCVLGAVLAAAGGTGAAALVPGVLQMQYVLPKRRESCHTSAVAAA